MEAAPRSLQFLVHRLSGSIPLGEADIAALAAIIGPPKLFHKGQVLVEQGERSSTIWLIEEGWALRQKMLVDGRRQIAALMLPGELSEKGPMMPFGAGDTVMAATDVVAQPINRADLLAVLDRQPALLKSMFFEELTRHAVTREWLLLLGMRKARERLAYFLYETYARLNAMGMIEGSVFDMPLVQGDLADMLGMSTVHLNRTLQRLRAANLVSWSENRIQLLDPPALARLAVFNPEMIRIAQEFEARTRAGMQDEATTRRRETASRGDITKFNAEGREGV